MTSIKKRNFIGKTFADLCCNTGSFRLAMEASGAKCVFASEENKYARNMYEANFGAIPESNLSEIDTYDIPYFDILCCGLPHESFITDGFEDNIEKIVKGTVFYDVLRIVHDKLPEVILLENVTKITLDGSLEIIVEALEKEGYIVHYTSLNALNYGVPQNRNRMYIAAFRDDIAFKEFAFPEPIELTKCVADILEPEEDIPAELYVRADDMVMKTDVKYSMDKPVQVAYVRKNSQGERIYSIDACAIALTANGGGRFSRTGGYLIGDVPRKLTSKECSKIMGFPDDYIITESNYMATKLFGSSVVVDVVQAIIECIEYEDKKHNCNGLKDNFNSTDLMEMIISAYDPFIEHISKTTYMWVSYDTCRVEDCAEDSDECFKNRTGGFIVKVEPKETEHLFDSLTRAFVEYVNEHFGRDFKYTEWYVGELDENGRDLFTDEQLMSIFNSCYSLCLENRYEKEPYFIVVDMEKYTAIRTTKYIELLEDKYESILIEPIDSTDPSCIFDNCIYSIEKFFDIIFIIHKIYLFRIYE